MLREAQKLIDNDDMEGLDKLISVLKDKEKYDDVIEIYDELYAHYCECGEQDHDEALQLLLDEGSLCDDIGRYERAGELYRLCYNISDKDSEKHISAAIELAQRSAYLGEIHSTKKYIDEAVNSSSELFGENSTAAVNALNRAAECLYRIHEIDDALCFADEALEKARRIDNDYEILRALQAKARIADDRYEPSAARELLTEAYDIAKEQYGEDDTTALSILTDIAGSYRGEDNFKKSLEIYKKVYDICKKSNNVSLHDKTVSKLNYALSLSDIGEHKKALKLKKEAYDVFLENYGERHDSTLWAMSCLSGGYGILNDYENAMKYAEKQYTIKAEIYGEDDIDTLGALFDNLKLYSEQHRYSEVVSMYENLVDRFFANHGPTYVGFYALNELVFAYLNLHMTDKSLATLERGFEEYKNYNGHEKDILTVLYNSKGSILSELGRHNEALECYEECVKIAGGMYDKEHPYYLNDLNDVAEEMCECGRYSDALELIDKVIETAERRDISFPNPYKKKRTKAKALAGLGRYDEVRAIIDEIYRLADGTPDEEELYRKCSKILDSIGDSKAAELAAHALDILRFVDEPDELHIRTLEEIIERRK